MSTAQGPTDQPPDIPAGSEPNQLETTKMQIREEQLEAIVDTLEDFFVPGLTSAGGFHFTPEEIEDQLTRCQQEIAALNADEITANAALGEMQPPAGDLASQRQAQAVRDWMNQVLQVIKSDATFLQKWQDTLTQVKNNYITNEHLTTDQWTALTKGLHG